MAKQLLLDKIHTKLHAKCNISSIYLWAQHIFLRATNIGQIKKKICISANVITRLICSALLIVKNIEKSNAFERKQHCSVNVYNSHWHNTHKMLNPTEIAQNAQDIPTENKSTEKIHHTEIAQNAQDTSNSKRK